MTREPAAVRLGLIVATLVVTFTSVARAGDARRHDGLYLRLGGGLGYGVDSESTDGASASAFGVRVNGSGKVEGTPKGFGGATELALGYTVVRGLVVGGGFYGFWFPPKATDVKVGGNSLGQDIKYDVSALHVFGPFVDYYPDEDEGLHLQGAVGLAWLTLGDAHATNGNVDVSTDGYTSTGLGLMLGIGDEWWVSDGFGLGVSARITMGFTSGTTHASAVGGNVDVDVDWNNSTLAPALLFTATMN